MCNNLLHEYAEGHLVTQAIFLLCRNNSGHGRGTDNSDNVCEVVSLALPIVQDLCTCPAIL